MSTELVSEIRLHLDENEDVLLADIGSHEGKGPVLIYLEGSLESWEKIKSALCRARASNVSALLLLTRVESLLKDEEFEYVLSFLREWDQLLLYNILQLMEGWMPKEFHDALQAEAKTEMKWFREWLIAHHDPRLHKYPGLPWRSYIRKIVGENFQFASSFLRLAASTSTQENRRAVDDLLRAFLEEKKKVVCLFPKRWGRSQ